VPRPAPQIGFIAGVLALAGSIAWGADPQPASPAVKVLTVGGASLSLKWDLKWISSAGAPDADTAEFHTDDRLTGGDAAVIFTVLYNDSGQATATKALGALEALQFSKGT
jgi:hypothetical protein